MTICVIENCEMQVRAHKLCNKHYTRNVRHGDPRYISPIVENFDMATAHLLWDRVAVTTENECWEWLKGKHCDGYGQVRFGGKMTLAHRIAFFIANNRWPTKCVLHSCDNRLCCNPQHLREGTRRENIHDMFSRNRQARGESSGMSKLTAQSVRLARELHATGKHTYISLAKRFGVTDGAIRHAIIGKSWSHI